MNYVKFAVPFFILLMLVEFIYGLLRKRQTYRLNDTVNSLQMGVISQFKGILRLSFSAYFFSALVSLLDIKLLDTANVWLWVLAFFGYDFCYYWKHRFGHEWRIMWAAHGAHHQSEEYNLSTALRQTSTGYIGFVFYIPMYLAGVPPEVMISVGSINLIYQFWVHTEHVRSIGVLEFVFTSPSNHRVHHARNPGYIDKNYAGVFIFWDRLFGTYQAELKTEPCVYGLTQGLKSWNPLWANFHIWYDTALISLRTKHPKDKLRIWFKGPGWLPADLEAEVTEKPTWLYAKYDPKVSVFARVYVFAQFILMVVMSTWLPLVQSDMPRALVLSLFFWALYTFFVQGVWLEARAYAEKLEWLRLVILASLLGLWHQELASLDAQLLSMSGVYIAGCALILLVHGFTTRSTSEVGITEPLS